MVGDALMQSDYDLKNRMAYGCSIHFYVAYVPNMPCLTCRKKMTYSVSYVPTFTPSARVRPVDVGFVKDSSSVKYIVLDNLEFMPMSSEYFVTLLKKFKINEEDGDTLEEIAVDFGMEEVCRLYGYLRR
ncbi:hypothetical protein LWI28_003837 [Acer negundo]|uniref:Uncharacterized protein n=1 Tax=Acer negundo TaxID=4023 RepID=A0AAD5IBH5_ACENE|nr:hypothetical protein LWI28_003837 [Acer negundo]